MTRVAPGRGAAAVFALALAAVLLRFGPPRSPDDLGVCLLWPGSLAGLAFWALRSARAHPSPAQAAAQAALLAAPPGTLGAVVVDAGGEPTVVATVRSPEEYMEMAAEGRFPADHRVHFPSDV